MRLARTRSQVDDLPETTRSTNRKNKAKSLILDSGQNTDSSESGRDITVNREDTADSEDDVANNKAKQTLCGVAKKESVTGYQNGKTSASSSKTSKKSDTKSCNENRKRRLKYMLAFSESSDEEVVWKPSPKRKKLWNEAKNSEAKSSDTDGVGTSEVSGDELQSEPEPQLNGGNENSQSKLSKKVKRLRKRRGKLNESENGTVLDGSDSDTSSDSVWYVTKTFETRNSSLIDRPSQLSTISKPVRNNTVRKWNGKHKRDGHKKTLIETSSDSSDNDEGNFSHKIPLRNKDNKVPNPANPEALAKLKVSYARSFNCNKSVIKDNCDNSASNNNKTNTEYVNNGGTVISPSLPSPSTPDIERHNRSLLDVETPDSGIVTAPCSSTGSLESSCVFSSRPDSSSGNHHVESSSSHVTATDHDGSDDPDWMIFKRFKSRLDRARRNYRNFIGDSDSN